MLRLAPIRSLACLCSALLASGCSDRGGDVAEAREAATPREFSAEDRRAAQVLSIGNVPGPENAGTPYLQALACSIALESITARLGSTGALDATQRRAMDMAQVVFDDRVEELAGQADKSTEEIEQDRQRHIADTSEADRLRRSIGCLRELT